MASWLPLSACANAVTGSPKEPGTHNTSGSWTPCSSNAPSAPRSRRFVTSSLKRDTTTAMRRSLPVRSGLAPFSPTAHTNLEKVTELVFLGLQVTRVVGVCRDADRHALDDLKTETLQSIELFRIVREQLDLANAKVIKNLASYAVVALVGRVAEGLVGLDSIQPAILQVVGVQLIQQPDATAFLVADVQDDANTVRGDHLHRRVQLGSAIAAKAAEDVPREALGMCTQQRRLLGIDLAEDQREMVLMAQHILVCVQLPLLRVLVPYRNYRFNSPRNQLLVTAPVGDH